MNQHRQKQILLSQTLYEITERWPATVPVFTSNGFSRMEDPQLREQFGRSLSLETALRVKQLDPEQFLSLLESAAGQNGAGVPPSSASERLQVTGLLPCPVRLPLLDRFNGFLEQHPELQLEYQLQAASMGVQWIEEHLSGALSFDDWPDLFLSAGFEMFFDKKMIGEFRARGCFRDLSGWTRGNSSFAGVDLADPQGQYSVIAAVPAVFLVNRDELGSASAPACWSDLFQPALRGRVSLPVGDFDLFNAILLNIYKTYGEDGLTGLAHAMSEGMHPAEMVKSDRRQQNRPAVTIMPYFFSRMVREGGPLELVWPSDGAILSPIFLLAKTDKAARLQPVVDFFTSREVGEVLAHDGLFPSLHPQVDNRLPQHARFLWPGWEYLAAHDISAVIAHCVARFETARADCGEVEQ